MTAFDDLMQQARQGRLDVTADWSQGRASFGGVVAAAAHEAMAQQLVDDRPLRAMAVSFVGPVAPDVPVSVTSDVLRQGRSVTQAEARLDQEAGTMLAAHGSFGLPRESGLRVSAPPAPSVVPPGEAASLPLTAGMTPAFLEHFDLRFCIGGFPFSGSRQRSMGGWMRFRQPPKALTPSHLIALIDTWPPAVLPMLEQPAPASSLSWSLELIHPLPELAPDDWLLYEAVIEHALEGYSQTRAAVWSDRGDLIALSHQTVVVFD